MSIHLPSDIYKKRLLDLNTINNRGNTFCLPTDLSVNIKYCYLYCIGMFVVHIYVLFLCVLDQYVSWTVGLHSDRGDFKTTDLIQNQSSKRSQNKPIAS